MLYWTLLFFFILAGRASASDPILTGKVKLRKDLLSDYNSEKRPVKNKNRALSITFQMTPHYFTMDENACVMTIRSIMSIKWRDEFLIWNPKDYSGVDSLRFDNDIWMPDESIYVSYPSLAHWNPHFSHPCDIQSNGSVTCLPLVTRITLCEPLQNQWPYEVLVCLLRFGSWVFTEEELKVSFAETPVSKSEYKENRQWSLISTSWSRRRKYTIYNNTYSSLHLSFTIKKRSATHAAIVVIPAVALAILTIGSGLMASGGIRIGVAVTSLIAQIFYLIEIVFFFPLHGPYPSHIVTLFVDCAIITTVTILMYSTIIAMTKLTHKPPRFISIIVTFAKIVPAKIITFGEVDSNEDSSIEDSKDQNSEESMANLEWRKFATIVNNTFFYMITIVYIVLLCIYV